MQTAIQKTNKNAYNCIVLGKNNACSIIHTRKNAYRSQSNSHVRCSACIPCHQTWSICLFERQKVQRVKFSSERLSLSTIIKIYKNVILILYACSYTYTSACCNQENAHNATRISGLESSQTSNWQQEGCEHTCSTMKGSCTLLISSL